MLNGECMTCRATVALPAALWACLLRDEAAERSRLPLPGGMHQDVQRGL